MSTLYDTLSPCGCFNSFQDQEIDFLKEFKHWFLVLNWQQGFLGRSLLILKDHKMDELELSTKEVLEKHSIYCRWRDAIGKAFSPDKINQSQLGNEEDVHRGHLHWHFVPRYRRRITLVGVEFPHDTPETERLNYGRVAVREVYSKEVRQRIKEEMLKYL